MQAKDFDLDILFKLVTDDQGKISVKDVKINSQDQYFDQDVENTEDGEEHVMVPPLQQSIELQKAAVGKESDVIDDLTQDENQDQDQDENQDQDEIQHRDADSNEVDDIRKMILFLNNTSTI